MAEKTPFPALVKEKRDKKGKRGLLMCLTTDPASDGPFSRFSHPGPTPSAESGEHRTELSTYATQNPA